MIAHSGVSSSSVERPSASRETDAAELLALARGADAAGEHETAFMVASRLLDLMGAASSVGQQDKHLLASAHLALASACYELGDFERAEGGYRQAAELYAETAPERMEALLGLGLCLDHRGLSGQSRVIYTAVLAAPGVSAAYKAVARRNLVYADGVACFSRGEFEAARAAFFKALSLHPSDDDFRSDILLWVGACSAKLGQFAAARDAYADLLGSTGTHESVKAQASQWCAFAEGQMHFAARRYADARAKFEEILARRGVANEFRNGVKLMAAHCCVQLRDYGPASRRYRQVLKTSSASQAQKSEARKARRAVPGVVERWFRLVSGLLGRHA